MCGCSKGDSIGCERREEAGPSSAYPIAVRWGHNAPPQDDRHFLGKEVSSTGSGDLSPTLAAQGWGTRPGSSAETRL